MKAYSNLQLLLHICVILVLAKARVQAEDADEEKDNNKSKDGEETKNTMSDKSKRIMMKVSGLKLKIAVLLCQSFSIFHYIYSYSPGILSIYHEEIIIWRWIPEMLFKLIISILCIITV